MRGKALSSSKEDDITIAGLATDYRRAMSASALHQNKRTGYQVDQHSRTGLMRCRSAGVVAADDGDDGTDIPPARLAQVLGVVPKQAPRSVATSALAAADGRGPHAGWHRQIARPWALKAVPHTRLKSRVVGDTTAWPCATYSPLPWESTQENKNTGSAERRKYAVRQHGTQKQASAGRRSV